EGFLHFYIKKYDGGGYQKGFEFFAEFLFKWRYWFQLMIYVGSLLARYHFSDFFEWADGLTLAEMQFLFGLRQDICRLLDIVCSARWDASFDVPVDGMISIRHMERTHRNRDWERTRNDRFHEDLDYLDWVRLHRF
ncbi:hypothetical protein PV327_011078, partial [Microctonus hyperodae]